MEEVCILGLGYIGLPTAVMFATNGVKVYGVDIVKEVCDQINKGQSHFTEPLLEDMIEKVVNSKMLTANRSPCKCKNYIITVPTPMTKNQKIDLSFVIEAAESLYPFIDKDSLVILESTVIPGCTKETMIPILEKSGLKAGIDFDVAYCPERVLPGQIIFELQHNNRIIGGVTQKSAHKAKKLYKAFVTGNIYLTDTVSAEMCKLMENTFRDVNIALANSLAKICERLGINVWEVIQYANKHPRVNILQPGPGVGGHCLAIDPWFIIQSAEDLAQLIKMGREINDTMPEYIFNKIDNLVPKHSKIIILGCTYKPDINDIRESPILKLINLLKKDYLVEVVDPYVKEYDKDIYETAYDAELLLLGVNHMKFESLDFELLGQRMKNKVILDTRNYYNRDDIQKYGFNYYLLGSGDYF